MKTASFPGQVEIKPTAQRFDGMTINVITHDGAQIDTLRSKDTEILLTSLDISN